MVISDAVVSFLATSQHLSSGLTFFHVRDEPPDMQAFSTMMNQLSETFSNLFRANLTDSCSDQLLPTSDFHEALQRERARIDRRGGNLCVVTFSKQEFLGKGISLEHIGQVLLDRLRLTDFAGWLNKQTLAVGLPFTKSDNAWQIAQHISNSLGLDTSDLACQVSRYPFDKAEHEVPAGVTLEHQTKPVHNAGPLFLRSMPWWKRSLDMLGAGIGLIALAPLMLTLAAVVRFSSPGPILFRQERGGQGGKPFTMLKFRSMVLDAEEQKQHLMDQNEQDGPAFKITHDPRVTKVGKWLRGTSMDELPQLWNVLKGDMSLVGPRPLPLVECQACSPWHKKRLDVTPGITCFWQCMSGKRVSFDDWMRLDIRYVRERSPMLDLSLICKTVFAVVTHKALKHYGEEPKMEINRRTENRPMRQEVIQASSQSSVGDAA